MSNSDMVLGIMAAIALCMVILAAGVNHIDQWERHNNYPYGQMCHSVFTGWQDTCPKGWHFKP